MPRGNRVDNNHAEIRDGLRELGFMVLDFSQVGYGIPDLLVGGFSNRLLKDAGLFTEIKRPGEYTLTPAEQLVHDFMEDFNIPHAVVHSIEDVLWWFGR